MQPPTVVFKIDMTEFDRALALYLSVSKQSMADIINRKAYWIARRAFFETPVTPRAIITSGLGQIRRSKKQIYTGNLRKVSVQSGGGEAPLVALIINSQRGNKGEKGLFGDAMKRAVAAFIGSRLKSRAFLKSGWLPAIRTMEPFAKGSKAGLPPMDRSVKQLGPPHGSATPAGEGWSVNATIENTADLDHFRFQYHVPTHNPDALVRFGGPALQRAFDKEAESMLEHVAEVQTENAKKIGIAVVSALN